MAPKDAKAIQPDKEHLQYNSDYDKGYSDGAVKAHEIRNKSHGYQDGFIDGIAENSNRGTA
jgi:hypothetical protein